jgi:tetratricopeptide (TPR) repeat protein
MTGAGRLAVIGAGLVGIGLAAGVLHAKEATFPLPPVEERLLYLQSGKTADRLMLTFDALAADVYWIRTIQSYGRDLKNKTRANRFELVQPLLELTTTLDPHFLIAYRFGAVFLAMEPPNGPGRPDQAIALLEKGLVADPTRWQLAHDIGFVHFLYTGDFREAADWFERAAAMPGAPSWLGPLAATTRAGGGDRAGARQMLADMLTSPDAYIRRAAERTLAQLDALDRIDAATDAVAKYRERVGHAPTGWTDLIGAGFLPGVPVDPTGVPFLIDSTAGPAVVTLSPESSLAPLPATMVRR